MDRQILDIAGNVLFCADGSTWGVWRVFPRESARSTGKQLRQLYERTVTLMKSLRGEVMIASLCEQVQPHAIVRRCLDGVDLDANPHWAETVHNAWDQLETLDVLGRSYWIAKPLDGEGWRESTQGLLRATGAALAASLGLSARPATASAIAVARERVRVAGQDLDGSIPIRPASEAELLWWLCRAPVRGVDEPQLETSETVHNTGISVSRSGRASLATLRGSVLDEGGRTDRAGGLLGPPATLNRRFLKCVTPRDDVLVTSYQAYLVLAEMPRAFTFPGHEILARLADIGFGVDYALRITATTNEEARASNRRRTRDLMSQDEEHGGDAAGVPADVHSAQEEIQHKNARLGASSTELDLEVGVVACVWGETADECDARAKVLRRAFLGGEYKWERPLGGQRHLYQALLPGYRTPLVLRECSQNLLATDAAMLLPVSATEFGDPTGALFGMVLDGGAIAPYLLDPTYGPTHDSSGGLAVIGELGAGKSVVLKNVAAVVRLMLDGRVIAVDRTRSREWVPVAGALPGNSQVVDVVDPTLDSERANSAELRYSCDPLRVFGGNAKTSTGIAEIFFAAWLDLESNSAERDALGRGLDAVSGTAGASSNALVDMLARQGKHDPAARALATRLQRLRRDPITRPIFDPDLPPVDLFDADMVVFCTHEIPLPSALEMSSERMAARVPPRKLFGRAFHLLIAAIAKEICFGTDRWGEFICDEAYNVTGTPEGQQIALEFVRDGRKHGADAAFGSHAAKDLGDDVLRGLIAVRFLGRHRDDALARQGLAWLGIDPSDSHYHEIVTRELSPLNPAGGEAERRARAGEFVVRDHAGRVGRVKVMTQPYRTLPKSVLTTPRIDRGGTRR
ncbi:ATP-binding protein [Amycolatopsis carbonis]|uniref:ATP-binding protein n=1 Tax=Amycolatopsis carbonis TaxID=715471 RepID=A0A9Y2IQI6_9PSEU|nr:ATP-binding protein [Amycolatopsis sp. 2-15]WIX82923.1 ATP-binding protein [Amycolatopsis sp. 2-15]